MKQDTKKVILYLIVIIPSVVLVSAGFFMHRFYVNKINNITIMKVNFIETCKEFQKNEAELQVKKLIHLFEKEKSQVVVDMKKDLQNKVNVSYVVAQNIYKKYKTKRSSLEIKERIKDSLSPDIFISDYDANGIVKGSHLKKKNIALYLDADYRSIVYEEIQTVRKHGEGFIKSRRGDNKKEEIIFVKELGLYGWYIGSSAQINRYEDKLKNKLITMMQLMPFQTTTSVAIFENENEIFHTKNFKINEKKYSYFSDSYKPFNWYIIYGINTKYIDQEL